MKKLSELIELIFIQKEIHQKIQEAENCDLVVKYAVLFFMIHIPWMAFTVAGSILASLYTIDDFGEGWTFDFANVFFNKFFLKFALFSLMGAGASFLLTISKMGDFSEDDGGLK